MGTKTVLKTESSFHDNRKLQSSHHCTSFALSDVKFYVLPFVTHEYYHKILELLHCFSDVPLTCNENRRRDVISLNHKLTCNEHWSGFLEKWTTSVLVVLIFIQRCYMQLLQSHLMHVGDQIQWKKAKPRSSANNKRLILQWVTCLFE